jgi:integrase
MSVHRRGDKWVAKVWIGGRWRWLGTFPTRKEARAAEQAERPSRLYGITVEQFADRWLTDYARPAETTRRSYRYTLAAFRKDFGSRRLGSIDPPEAQRWATKAPYFQYRAVRTMYADALRAGVVQANPFAGLRIPQPQGRRRLDVLDEGQVERLADCAVGAHGEHLGPTVRALILVAGFVGLRAGELGGLEWGDVDLRSGQLHVMRSLTADGLKPPKNGEPRRVVLPPKAADALASLERFQDEPAVFLTPRGKRFGKGAIHRYFAPVRASYGHPRMQFHELRHACATLLLERGLTPEDVALQLGHQDGGQLVRQLYGHPSEDRARERIAMAFAEVPSKPVADRSQEAR